jgi:hypothetical protein
MRLSEKAQRIVNRTAALLLFEEKTLKFGDESITCVGGPQLSAILRSSPNRLQSRRLLQTDIISLNCVSERGLHILFVTKPYWHSFYSKSGSVAWVSTTIKAFDCN